MYSIIVANRNNSKPQKKKSHTKFDVAMGTISHYPHYAFHYNTNCHYGPSLPGTSFLMIVEGSFNAELFGSFIRDLLDKMLPFPAPNSVIVMDNCAIHKGPEIRELIEARYVIFRSLIGKRLISFRGMKLEYLPAYSPDFNPIELAFSLLKHGLRRKPPPDGSDFEVQEYLYMQTLSISAADCETFYHHSGYL